VTGSAWIGEHGPELLSLPGGAQVIPLPKPPEPETPEGES
jgi:phage-related tail protein